MTKSELIDIIAAKQNQLSAKDVELAVKTLIELMSETLATGERIEVRVGDLAAALGLDDRRVLGSACRRMLQILL